MKMPFYCLCLVLFWGGCAARGTVSGVKTQAVDRHAFEGSYAFVPTTTTWRKENLWRLLLLGNEPSSFFSLGKRDTGAQGDRVELMWSDSRHMEMTLWAGNKKIDHAFLLLNPQKDCLEFPATITCPIWAPLILHVIATRNRTTLWVTQTGDLCITTREDGILFGPFVPMDLEREVKGFVFPRLPKNE